jgi:acyl carrier protein
MKSLLKTSKFSLNKTIKLFSTQIQPWVEVESRINKIRGELVLSDQSKIEKYAVNLIKNYYRSTNKDAITKDSDFKDHGLDSIDSLELCVQLEDELGYIIEAETMPKLTKVKHFINFIKHMEAYKQEHKVLPQEAATSYEASWEDWLPKGDKLKEKLVKHTKEAAKH